VLETLFVLFWEQAEAIVAFLPFLHHYNPPSRILDGLYLGAYAPYNTFPVIGWLKSMRITHLVSVGGSYAPISKAIVLRIEVSDSALEKLPLTSAVQFIHEARANGGQVLVHCAMGASRSSAVVIAYLIAAFNLDRDQALQFTARQRPLVGPNAGFWEQVRAFEGTCMLDEIPCTQLDYMFIDSELALIKKEGPVAIRGWQWRVELAKLLWRPLSVVGGGALVVGATRWRMQHQQKGKRFGAARL
jgi:hypothetical protein